MADKRVVAVHVTFSEDEWAALTTAYHRLSVLPPHSKADLVRAMALAGAAHVPKKKRP